MAKILVIEDDTQLAEVLAFRLSSQGHAVQTVHGGKEAISILRINKYDLLILDWMMPEVSGLDVLKEFRASGGKTPILMLTAKSLVTDKEVGLDTGADDYLTKPFDYKELLARVRALLRRPTSVSGTILTVGDIALDPVTCLVTKSGAEIHLRPKVYSLLEFFMRHPNQLFTAEALLERVWLDDSTASPDTVRTHLKLLRRSLSSNNDELIRTIRNRGYMLSKKEPPAG